MMAARSVVALATIAVCVASFAGIAQPAPEPSYNIVDIGNGIGFPENLTERDFHAEHSEVRCFPFEDDTWCTLTEPDEAECLGVECGQVSYIFSGGILSKINMEPSETAWNALLDVTSRRLGAPKVKGIDTPPGIHVDIYQWSISPRSIGLSHTTGSDVYGRPIKAPYSLYLCVSNCNGW